MYLLATVGVRRREVEARTNVVVFSCSQLNRDKTRRWCAFAEWNLNRDCASPWFHYLVGG
jgi:hypothetical protein